MVSAFVTTHPKVIPGQSGEFETCPDWVPGVDTGQRFAPISLKTIRAHGFDHMAN